MLRNGNKSSAGKESAQFRIDKSVFSGQKLILPEFAKMKNRFWKIEVC